MKRFLIVLLFVFLFCSCDLNKNPDETEDVSTVDETPPELTPYPLFINDIEITESPDRIVCLTPSLTEMIYELGYGERLVGRGSYCDYPPVVLGLPDMGSSANPNFDRIITLAPSLVLTSTQLSDKDVFTLEQNGIKILVIPACSDLEGLREIYKSLGLILEGIFTGIDSGEQAFSVVSKACDNKEVINIGNFIYITENFKIATGDTLEHAVLSCFGNNLAESGTGYEFDLTTLNEKQPDIILLNDKYTAGDLTENEFFDSLEAFQNGRIIYINSSFLERPSARIAEMINLMISDYKVLSQN